MAKVTDRRAEEVLKRHEARLLRRKGVIAVGVGYAMRKHRRDSSRPVAIRIYVGQKVDEKDLPPGRRFEKQIEGIPVDVVQARAEKAACDDLPGPNPPLLNAAHDPLMGGLAIRASLPGGGQRGTLGAILVTSSQHPLAGTTYFYFGLTAHHVLSQQLCTTALGGLLMLQPGPAVRPFGRVPPANGAFRTAQVDAGVALLPQTVVDSFGVRGAIEGLGDVAGTDAPVKKGLKVRKVGAKTGCTRGVVVHTSFKIAFQCTIGGKPQTLRMRDQILVDPATTSAGDQFADGGDSGALVVDGENRPLGLLHGRLALDNGRAAGILTPLGLVLSKWPTLRLVRGKPPHLP